MVQEIQHYLVKIDEVLAYLWYLYLMFVIIKTFITKSLLDRMKRNIIIIKCISHLFYGYFCIPFLLLFRPIIKQDYTMGISFNVLMIILITIDIGILLFYSGTPFIFFQKKVTYSWPLKNNESLKNTSCQSSD